MRPWTRRSSRLSEKHCRELVAVEVAEIRGIEAVTALARRAFVAAAERQRLRVQATDLFLACCTKRDHGAVADRRRIAVERLDHADAGLVLAGGPGLAGLAFPDDLGVVFGEQGFEELDRARQIV